MTPLKRNLSRLLFLTLVLTLGGIIFGVVYYLKMDRNEDTLNTLLFRELQQVEGTIQRSLEKVQATAKYTLPEEYRDYHSAGEKEKEKETLTDREARLNWLKKASDTNFNKLQNSSSDLADIKVHNVDETYDCGEKGKEQCGFSFTIPEFNTVRFKLAKHYPKEHKALILTLESSIHFSLKQRGNRFQTVALVDATGNVKSVVNHAENLSNNSELFFKKVLNLSLEQESATSRLVTLQGTQFVDVKISDSDYRAYLHPIMSKGFSGDDTHYYLVGIIKKSFINEQKLKLAPELLMWLILALLLLIAIIPLIKLRFISATAAIQSGDKSQIVLGLLVTVGVITIAISQHLFVDYLLAIKKEQLLTIHREIKQDFNSEISTLLDGVSMLQKSERGTNADAAYYSVFNPQILSFIKDEKLNKAFIESIIHLSAQGAVNATEYKPIVIASDAVKNTQTLDLSGREYVKAGISNKYWHFTTTGYRYLQVPYEGPVCAQSSDHKLTQLSNNLSLYPCISYIYDGSNTHTNFSTANHSSSYLLKKIKLQSDHQVYLQRIFNIEDGRRNLMLALPAGINSHLAIKHPKDTADKYTHMYIAGTRLSALVDRVLPNNFGYAVVDDEGKVLFHSDDSLSLIENFFTETNQNPQLLVSSQHHHAMVPTLLDVEYKGIPHQLVIGSLAEGGANSSAESGIPWQLIVFYDPQELQTNNMVLVFVAVLLFLLVLIPAFILLRYVTHQRFWQEVCGFDEARKNYYLPLGLMLFAVSFCIQFQMGWLQSILGRLLLWGILCTAMAYLLVAVFKLRLSFFYWWRQPLLAFTFLLLPLLSVNWIFDSGIDFETEKANWLSAALGGLVFIGSIAFLVQKLESISQWQMWIRTKVEALLLKWKALVLKPKAVIAVLFLFLCGLFVFVEAETVWWWLKNLLLAGSIIILIVVSLKAEKWFNEIEGTEAANESAGSNEQAKNANIVVPLKSLAKPGTPKLHKESTRFSVGFVIFLTGLIYLGASAPASLIAYSAHDYLLQRKSQFETAEMQQAIEEKQANFSTYLSFINGKSCQDKAKHSLCDLELNIDLNGLLESYFPDEVYCFVNGQNQCDTQWAKLFDRKQSEGGKGEFTDNVFDILFSQTPSETEFISHLSYAAKQDLNSRPHSSMDGRYELRYRTDLLMLSAISKTSGFLIMLIMLFGLPYGLYLVMRQLVVKRLLGEHLQDQYAVRSGCKDDQYYAYEFPDIEVGHVPQKGHSLIVLNSTRLTAEQNILAKIKKDDDKHKEHPGLQNIILHESKVFRITDCLDKFYSTKNHCDDFYFLDNLNKAISDKRGSCVIVALSGLEQVSLNSEARQNALALLYELHLKSDVTLVLVAETAPLYRLLNPGAYDATSTATAPDIDEKNCWTKLFSEFEKHYAWSPLCKSRLENLFDIQALIKHECMAWPELKYVKEKFDNELCSEPEQVIEFMLVHAGALYRRKWEECTVKEKLILWKMAHGASINPESAVTIERLVRRCYLFRDKGWHLVNESFRQFILTAEPESVIKDWMDNTSSGAWSVLRIPIFAILLVLLAIFVYSSGSSLNTLLSIATATLGLIPLLIKNFSLLRGGGTEIE